MVGSIGRQGDLVLDPMAGGGVAADTCLAFHRKCWSFDLDDRPETRPEIEPYQWNVVSQMQKNRTLGVVRRSLTMEKKK
jgi:hypothetical protein